MIKAIIRGVVSIVLCLAGVYGSFGLLSQKYVGEITFTTLVALSIIVSLVVFFADRIKAINLKQLYIEFEKVERARKEVENKEKEVKAVALALADITLFLASFNHRLGDDEDYDLQIKWLKKRVDDVMRDLDINAETKQKYFRFIDKIEEADRVRATDKNKSSEIWKTIKGSIKEELLSTRAE